MPHVVRNCCLSSAVLWPANISWHLTAVLATILSLVARQEDAMYRDRDAEASF